MIQELDIFAYGDFEGVQMKHHQFVSVQGDPIIQRLDVSIPIEVGRNAGPALQGLLTPYMDDVRRPVEVAVQAGQPVTVRLIKDVLVPHTHREDNAGGSRLSVGGFWLVRHGFKLHEQVGEFLHDGGIPLINVGGGRVDRG